MRDQMNFDVNKAWNILCGDGLAAGSSKEDCYEKLGWLMLFMKEYEHPVDAVVGLNENNVAIWDCVEFIESVGDAKAGMIGVVVDAKKVSQPDGDGWLFKVNVSGNVYWMTASNMKYAAPKV